MTRPRICADRRAAPLPLRYALRELRGGLRGFTFFIACTRIGVMAIAGVGSVAAKPQRGTVARGPTLLAATLILP